MGKHGNGKQLLVPEIVEPECPSVAGWPDDEFARWVSAHRDEALSAICDKSEFGDLPFCEIDIEELGLPENITVA